MTDINNLCLALPEDIAKAKGYGDFNRVNRLIDKYLNRNDIANCLKERLLLEKEVVKELPFEYPYTFEEAYNLVKKEIPDFTEEELNKWIDDDIADWIYINGQIYLQRRFFLSIKKVYPKISLRAGIVKSDENFKLLEKNMNLMKENGITSIHHKIHSSISIKDEYFIKDKTIHVHLPIPMECKNVKNIIILNHTESDKVIISDSQKSRTIYFEEVLKENHSFDVEYEYDCTAEYNELDDDKCTSTIGPSKEEVYPAIVYTPFIKALAKELIGNETNALKVARKFYDYCTKVATYSYMRKYLTLTCIPDYIGASLKGDCGVQAILFITLCRYAGIDAHFQSGLYTAHDDISCHDWAMFYIEPYGWLFADPSFGGSAYRAKRYQLHDFYFGNLDPYRMVANNDICAEFIPAKKHLRNDPYDNQTGEIEYDDYGLNNRQIITKQYFI